VIIIIEFQLIIIIKLLKQSIMMNLRILKIMCKFLKKISIIWKRKFKIEIIDNIIKAIITMMIHFQIILIIIKLL